MSIDYHDLPMQGIFRINVGNQYDYHLGNLARIYRQSLLESGIDSVSLKKALEKLDSAKSSDSPQFKLLQALKDSVVKVFSEDYPQYIFEGSNDVEIILNAYKYNSYTVEEAIFRCLNDLSRKN